MTHSFEIRPDGVVWRGDGETVYVQAWGADSLRTRSTRAGELVDTDYALLPPSSTAPTVTVEGDVARVVNGRIVATLTACAFLDVQAGYPVHQCRIDYTDTDGTVLLRELETGGSLKYEARHLRGIPGGAHRITASFEANDGERLYGMGQYQQALMDLKGATLELAHRNSQASVPFVLSSRGYGLLWHNPAIGRATFAANRSEWTAESALQLDYWITAGATPAAITAAYADATGHVPMMPEHGLGYWQCKLRYWNQEQLLDVAREHKRRGLPMDVIVADFFHWPTMGDFRFEEEFWPDPQAMVDELCSLGIELMVSVWPQISVHSENFDELARMNALVRVERGANIQMSFEEPSAFLDATNPAARDKVWEICKRNYADLGIKLFWLDEAEPEYAVYDFDQQRYHQGPAVQVANIYPQAYSRAFYEGQMASGQTDVVNLVRCAWAGSQRYGALAWSGDIHSTWTDLRRQITAAIHMGIAGIPWFTTDIGGFHDGHIEDPEFHELLIRWFQFATFCPVMRMHGDRKPVERVTTADGERRLESGAPNELWSFGDQVYDVLASYVHLREELRPYLRQTMRDAHEHGQPVLRAMFHEFPDDARCWTLKDQFMLGGELVVAPVVDPGARARKVYLPAGVEWHGMHDGSIHAGGEWIETAAPLDVIPVYSRGRAGSASVSLPGMPRPAQ
ncbi:glycoside hydrolase family 31 protein [Demequina capsici]|uniref:Glycoside hydrolase family 31 protein n=1 Tax=Demequina capsici TaxID=3075620 RepID=A0AA96JA46_9MICO|nr:MULTISPECIES: TIM-barrel domain-containing protein [unclassified Demequina]WNM23739.1 glycoside hydrolase family 31 protein [Demequina sp. OYTSA14]WNM26578.1 glycoside hydrolase family 31 protein [Demequina sp. PMTSA13]